MRVRLIKRQTIVDFVKANSQAKEGFDNWMFKLKYASWNTLNDIKTPSIRRTYLEMELIE